MYIVRDENIKNGELNRFIAELLNGKKIEKVKSNKKNHFYVNLPIAFDTEATSAYVTDNGNVISTRELRENYNEEAKKSFKKIAFTYIWCFKIFDCIFVGRYLEQLQPFLNILGECLGLMETEDDSASLRAVVYVHNLHYDFQFFRKYVKVQSVFAKSNREAISVISDGFEFKCSYALSARSLEGTAENLTKHDLKKLKGDLEYELLRHNETPLTETELNYCYEDVNIVQAYIEECIDEFGNIGNIPLTNTGRVRRFVRGCCLYPKNSKGKSYYNSRYVKDISKSTMDIEEYMMLSDAKGGGYTHANALYVEKTIDNVKSVDETSAYPAAMIMRTYPIGKGWKAYPKNQDDFKELINKYHCLIQVRLKGVKVKKGVYDAYLSYSKIEDISKDCILNNGRVQRCSELITTITDIDLMIIERCYDIENKSLLRMYCYKKSYLPNEYRRAILKLYKDKTELKGIVGMEDEYMRSKGMCNSSYGMICQDPVNDEVIYEFDQWKEKTVLSEDDIKASLSDYNSSKTRFTCYAWGVWITAWARYALWQGIIELGEDYIYTDTDSLKYVDWVKDMQVKGYYNEELQQRYEHHEKFFNDYNNAVKQKMETVMKVLGLSDDWNPKDKDGIRHPLGYWDDDGHYERFKTLGAKRYIVEKYKKGELVHEITISGVNKNVGIRYIKEKATNENKDIFEVFEDGLVFTDGHSGKLTHTYIDDTIDECVTDYLGNVLEVNQLSGIHMDSTSYTMGIADYFKIFLNKIRKGHLH